LYTFLISILSIKYTMGLFGKLGKVFRKIKEAGKKVWGGIKNVAKKVMPIAKKVVPMIAGAYGGPGASAAASGALEVGDQVLNGDLSGALEGARNISWKF
jgi:hypothetical protein